MSYFAWTNPANPPKENALLIAAYLTDRVKVRETGANRGFWVAKFLKAAGLNPGYAWCAAFVTFCLKEAGWKGGFPKGAAAVRNWHAWACEVDRITSDPKRGDLFYWVNKNGTGHIGFVVEREGNVISTIEGNTNEAGSREGDGAYRKDRAIGPSMRFIRL